MMIEPIERRTLLHSIFLDNGLLIIQGFDGLNDNLSVVRVGDVLRADSGDGDTEDFAISSVTRGISLTGGTGNDTLTVGGDVTLPSTLQGGQGDDSITGGAGKDRLEGGGGNDVILGNGGRDLLFGDDGNDTLSGGTKNDTLDGGAGGDFLVGSAGLRDLVTYAARPNAVSVTLDGVANDGESGESDNIAETVEFFAGGSGNDTLRGSGKANFLTGGAGNDTLIGGSGNDTLDGGAGSDSLSGQAGNDRLQAEDGAIDTVSGGSGTDTALVDQIDVVDSVP